MKVKIFLNKSQMKILTQALVISSLDYCNALYYGIDSQLMKQLQVIQNRACRVIFGLKRRDSVDSYIKELHWLKVEQRIQFKILLLAYKCLNGSAPSYLADLLRYSDINSSRDPALKSPVPRTLKGERAFQCSAARLWNAMPRSVKFCVNVGNFKRNLKTYLFAQCFRNVN